MKKIFTLLTLFVTIAVAASAATDKFANYTVSPASGSSITDAQFRHITLTFPDLKNIKCTSTGTYEIYTESEYEKGYPEGKPISDETTFLDYKGVCDFDGNKVTVNIKEQLPESGRYVLVFSYRGFCDADNPSITNQDEIAIRYNIEVKGSDFTLSPSNAAPVSMVDLWPVTITFKDAKKITLLDGFWERGEVSLLNPKGEEISTLRVSSFANDHWSVDGNVMKVQFYESDRQKFTEAGEYTIVFKNGSVIVDDVPQGEIRIKYNVTLPERPAEGPVALSFANYIDEENRLFLSIPDGYEHNGSIALYGNKFFDANGKEAGRMTDIHAVDDSNKTWYIVMDFLWEEKDPKMKYTVDIDEGVLGLRDVYYVDHAAKAATVTFFGSKEAAAGIRDVTVNGGEAVYYTLDGIRVAKPETGKVYIEKANGIARKIAVGK